MPHVHASRSPGDARRANVHQDHDAAAEDQDDHSQARPRGGRGGDAGRQQPPCRRQLDDLLGRETPPLRLGDQGPQASRRLLAGLPRSPPGSQAV